MVLKPPAPLPQEVLHDEGADQVAVNFFGDGTCNVGATHVPACFSSFPRLLLLPLRFQEMKQLCRVWHSALCESSATVKSSDNYVAAHGAWPLMLGLCGLQASSTSA